MGLPDDIAETFSRKIFNDNKTLVVIIRLLIIKQPCRSRGSAKDASLK